MKNLLCWVALLLISTPLFSQVTITETTPTSLTACGKVDTVTLVITNTSSQPANNAVVDIQLPIGIYYAGFISSNATIDASDLSNPLISIDPFVGTITIKYTVFLACDVIGTVNNGSTVANSTSLSYNLGTSGTIITTNTTADSYQINFASLDILVSQTTPAPPNQMVDLLEGVNRLIQITNGGTGSLDTVTLVLTLEPELELVNLQYYVAPVGPSGLVNAVPTISGANNNIYTYKFFGPDLFFSSNMTGEGSPFSLDLNESLFFFETSQVRHCGQGSTAYQVNWGCGGEVCNAGQNNAQAVANVNINTGNPNVSVVADTVIQTNWCGDSLGRVNFNVVNNSTEAGGIATDFKITWNTNNTLAYSNFTINNQPVIPTVTVYGWSTQYVVDLNMNTNAALGLLDLDGDGFLDDLPNNNQYFDMSVDVSLNCLAQANVCPTQMGHYINPQVNYSNQCGTINETRGGFIWGNFPTISGPSLINGPSDIVANDTSTYTFCDSRIDNNLQGTLYSCPNATIISEITVPAGVVLANTAISFQGIGLPATYTASQTGNLITIVGGEFTGCYSVDLTMDCSGSGTGTIHYEKKYFCDTACSDCVPIIGCDDFTIVGHNDCFTQGDTLQCGIETISFSFERTTFGYADTPTHIYSGSTLAGMTPMTRAQAITAGALLDKAYVRDNVQSITTGIIMSTPVVAPQLTITYTSPNSVPVNMFDYISAGSQVTIGGNPCSISAPVIDSTAKPFYVMTYDITPCVPMNVGDTIQLIANYNINPNAVGVGAFDVTDIRSFFSSIIDTSRWACDNWGAHLRVLKVVTSASPGSVNVTCNGGLTYEYFQTSGGESGDEFPFEFRRVNAITSVSYDLPPGYAYTAGSGLYVNYWGFSSPILDATLTQTGSVSTGLTLTFTRDGSWPYFDRFNGGNGGQYFRFEIHPISCEAPLTGMADISGSITNFENNPPYVQSYNYNFSNVTVSFNQPNLTVTYGQAIQEGFTSTSQWTMTICNQSDLTHPAWSLGTAPNMWISVQPSANNGGIVSINNALLTPSAGLNVLNSANNDEMFIEIGDMLQNQCKTIKIQASYSDCIQNLVDTLIVKTGWNCGGYPNVGTDGNIDLSGIDTVDCHVSEGEFYIRYKNATLQWTGGNAIDNNAFYPVCTPIPFSVDLISASQGSMDDILFGMELPTGLTIQPGSAQYLYTLTGGTVTNLPAPTINGSALEWDIDALIMPSNDLPGTVDTSMNKIRLFFNLVPGCDYNESDVFKYYTTGVTNCGETIPLVAEKHIHLEVLGNKDSLGVTLNSPDFTCFDSIQTFTISVVNLGDSPTTVGEITFDLASYTDYAGTASGPSHNPPLTSSFNQTSSTLSWDLPVGVVPGDSVVFSFNVDASIEECRLMTFQASANSTRTITCNNEVCEVKATVSTVSYSDSLCCPSCPIDGDFTAMNVCLGDSICFTPVDTASISTHLWDFGDGTTSSEVAPCHLYTSAGIYTVSHILSVDTCSTITFNEVEVLEEPHGAIELIGCNPFCEGDTVYLTVTGNYTSIEWQTSAGTSLGVTDTLLVTSGGTYTAILFNGICSDTCLSILIHSNPNPVIDILDVMICADDSTTLDAGAGYQSYLWSNGATTQTITVGPGTYWVNVGQQLPVGCCLCHGIDTVTVTVDSIAVVASDTLICLDQPYVLPIEIVGGISPYTITVSNATSQYVLTSSGGIVNATVADSGAYNVSIVDALGCTASDSGTIFINYPIYANFSYDDTICVMDTACFTALYDGIDEWIISNGATLITTGGDVNPFCYKFYDVGTYTVTHIISNICGSDTVTNTITVVPPIEACIVMTGSNPFCEGDSVLLTVNDPNNLVTAIDWYDGNGNLVFTGDVFVVTTSGTYSAVIHDQNGCLNSCMCIVLSMTPAPKPSLPAITRFCKGSSVVLDPGVFDDYLWNTDATTQTITVNTPGLYSVTVSENNAYGSCSSTISTQVIKDSVRIDQALPGDTVICKTATINLSTTYFSSGYTYEWYRIMSPGINTLIGSTQTVNNVFPPMPWGFAFSLTTRYFVVVTDPVTGCTDRDTVTVRKLKTPCNVFEIMLSPNPTVSGEAVTLSYQVVENEESQIIITDEIGNKMESFMLNPEQMETTIKTTNYRPGVYFVTLYVQGNIMATEKMVVVK